MGLENQNDPANIDILIARHRLAQAIELWQLVQIVFVVLVPSIFAVAIIFMPALRPWAVLLPAAVAALDPLVMDRKIKALTLKQARFAELFDCEVFGLTWDSFVSGAKPLSIEINELVLERDQPDGLSRLTDWYPVKGDLTAFQQVVLAQESSILYDMQLRKYYSRLLTTFSVVFFPAIFVLGFVGNLNIQDFVVLLAPLIPIIGWITREFIRTRDAEAKNTELHALVREQRLRAPSISDEEAAAFLRGMQRAIFLRRAKYSWVPAMFYRRRRGRLEAVIGKNAASIAKSLSATAPAGSGTAPKAD